MLRSQKSSQLDLPGDWKRVKTASERLDWWAVIQTPWKLSEEIWRWETRHGAHVLKCRWEVRGHIDPIWHNDALQWWLIRGSWKFPKCSALVCYKMGFTHFIKWEKHLLYRVHFTWIQNIIQSHCRTSHPWSLWKLFIWLAYENLISFIHFF